MRQDLKNYINKLITICKLNKINLSQVELLEFVVKLNSKKYTINLENSEEVEKVIATIKTHNKLQELYIDLKKTLNTNDPQELTRVLEKVLEDMKVILTQDHIDFLNNKINKGGQL